MISNILYLRNFFDEESFLAIPYETTKLRILSTKSSNKNVLSIIEMLEGLFSLPFQRQFYIQSFISRLLQDFGEKLLEVNFYWHFWNG